LNRHVASFEKIKFEVDAWKNHRNNKDAKINWQFTNDKVRIKLKRLYPSILIKHNTSFIERTSEFSYVRSTKKPFSFK
jgi:hypothetical protein